MIAAQNSRKKKTKETKSSDPPNDQAGSAERRPTSDFREHASVGRDSVEPRSIHPELPLRTRG